MDAFVGQLRLDPGKRSKVGGYYHDLEIGNLDPEPVDRRVWDVLADVLKANVRGLAMSRPEAPGVAASAYMRREPTGMQAKLARAPEAPKAEEPDEVDRLFTAGA